MAAQHAATADTLIDVTFFETLVALLAVAVLLLQVARRAHVPYPAVLAAAGVAVATLPGAPAIPIDAHTALALFIAPVLVDAAYDYPLGSARRMAVPLIVFAVVAVLATTVIVVTISALTIALPLAAAITLGAIVAPPDAAAATAVLANLPVARRVDALLKGESLFNDATALLLFTAALTVQARGGLDSATFLQLLLAAPGGIVFGIGFGWVMMRIRPVAGNTVGGTLMQFVYSFATWLIAERLHLSAVLATVASAMTIANLSPSNDSPRMRVHSFAVWTTVVFLLNVLAFLLMGLQARSIVGSMHAADLARALSFAGAIIIGVILARLLIAFLYRAVAVRRARSGRAPPPMSVAETFLVGWTGMRGLVTLATAFALPADFPERDLLVLTAFAVVLATLVIQGATLAPIIRWLRLGHEADARAELAAARADLAKAALARLDGETSPDAEILRRAYRQYCDHLGGPTHSREFDHRRGLALAAVLAQRARLDELRAADRIGPEHYLELQEDLDWKQLAVASDEDRRIREN